MSRVEAVVGAVWVLLGVLAALFQSVLLLLVAGVVGLAWVALPGPSAPLAGGGDDS